MELVIQSDRSHNGQKILFQKIIQYLRIYTGDLAHIADILSVCIFLFHMKQTAVLAADAHCIDPKLLDHAHQALIYLTEDHLRNLHGLLIRDTKPINKSGLLAHLGNPAADLLAAAVNDDGLKAYQL